MKLMREYRQKLVITLLTVLMLAQVPIQAATRKVEGPLSVPVFATVDKNFQQPFSSAARTATATSSTFEIYGAETLVCYLSVTAASGSSPTLDVKFQDSPDGGTTWFDIAGASFTQATAATTQVVSASRKFARKIRCVATIGGTTPSFTFSVTIMTY
jgi:hypothetical protein